MANSKNTLRSKRKYGANREAATARNKESKRARHERRRERLMERTKRLVGREVQARSTKFGTFRGTVTAVVPPPAGSLRQRGQFLEITNVQGTETVSRHRVKVL